MTSPSRLSSIGMGATALILGSILAFLYVRTQAHDASSYFENVAVLRQLKQLDAQWELDVLKSKMHLNTNYDALVDPLVALNQLREQLRRAIGSGGAAARPLIALDEHFHRAIDEKTRLIEHFKSHNSVLRNSLTFLPTAAADIENAMRAAGAPNAAQKKFLADLDEVLLAAIVFSQAPSQDKAAEVQSELDGLNLGRRRFAETIRDATDIFSAHVTTVLREQPEVNQLLNSIAQIPTSAAIDAIDNALASNQRAVELQNQQYRKYLLVFACALAGLFLYAAISLIRSHAVINRVNLELQVANATLEERVQDRTRELKEAQNELVSTARQAGMAEIANNVLHNVGNVLTSVNVSAGVVCERIRESKAQSLAKVTDLLDEHSANLSDFLTRDERGKVLPGYLKKLAGALASERLGILEELGSMTRSIDHIKEIVAKQQSYSGATSVLESVQVGELLEDALHMNATSMGRHRITVIKELADVPVLLLDRHLVLQILINLIRNAMQAMEDVKDRMRHITFKADLHEAGDELRLRISVQDEGEGITPDNVKRLFAHGFTTRKSGHGFGLHSCALAAKEMRGTITAHSDGPGKGAIFTLELPVITGVPANPVSAALVA